MKKYSVSISPGTVTVAGKKISAAVPGLKAADILYVSTRDDLALGVALANARATADDAAEIYFTTSVVVGVNAGTITVDILAVR